MNENNQPQSQQTKRELTFKAGDLCMAWHYNQYDKVDLFYCRLESVGYEYATGELFYDEEMTRKAGRRKDICVADLMPWSEAGKANKQPSESSHSPTEQSGDAKHTPGPWKLHDDDRTYGRAIRDQRGHLICVPSDQKPHTEDESFANAELIARAPALLSEVSTLRSKQAELVAELEQLRSELDRLIEAIDVVMVLLVDGELRKPSPEEVKMAYEHLDFIRYGKSKSALSGGSK